MMIKYSPDNDNGPGGNNSLKELEIECPWCWQAISLLLDCSAGDQSYSEDCEVCCQPMMIKLKLVISGEIELAVSREGE